MQWMRVTTADDVYPPRRQAADRVARRIPLVAPSSDTEPDSLVPHKLVGIVAYLEGML